jgi:hypothetical protein
MGANDEGPKVGEGAPSLSSRFLGVGAVSMILGLTILSLSLVGIANTAGAFLGVKSVLLPTSTFDATPTYAPSAEVEHRLLACVESLDLVAIVSTLTSDGDVPPPSCAPVVKLEPLGPPPAFEG